ncbi:hypothetical protein B0H15DRAFT_866352 [Mycena belliarum]|uniref:Uncharacterized protein n=1 Tax=Mycena belliarum TaxID=1033014 RepID=A0AAD6TUD9_9AGAR|nr:hypothetical protein B0H15DRAFT_866352 [Mycena belliae]
MSWNPSAPISVPELYFWAVIKPSAVHSVAYLKSSLATSAAAQVKGGEYLALVLDPNTPAILGGRLEPNSGITSAYLVQPSRYPLPDAFLPIAPCGVGTRKPVTPDFEWPFEECVIDTGRHFIFQHVSADTRNARPYHGDAARALASLCIHDGNEEDRKRYRKRLAAEKVLRGLEDLSSKHATWWTTFSRKSRVAEKVPGQFFAPEWISAEIRYDIESFDRFLPVSQCFDDMAEIERFRAKFSRPSTERTIHWTLAQAPYTTPDALLESAAEIPCPSDVIEYICNLEGPRTPGPEQKEDLKPEGEDGNDDDDWDPWRVNPLDELAYPTPPPPSFEPDALQVVYLDIFGTLIDNEKGLYTALGPLLARCPFRFERAEALSFYLESEDETKERMPTAPYSEILLHAYTAMARRLGLTPSDTEAFAFAASIARWPLVDGAVACLRALRPHVPALVALVDLDDATLQKCAAFSALAPYFAEMWPWDASQEYRPYLDAFEPSFTYHDNMGVPRERRCFVSSGLYRDLEPASECDIPVIWVRNPDRIAGSLPSDEATFAWKVCDGLDGVIRALLPRKVAGTVTTVELQATIRKFAQM